MAQQWLACVVVCTFFTLVLSGLASSMPRSDRYCSGSRYHILRDPWRSVQVEDRYPPRRCDSAEGFEKARWYRFAGEAGAAMPTGPPPSDHRCGSDAPVWVNGTNPRYEDGVVRRQACARFAGDVCAWEWTIRVKRCPEGFLIYKLKPVKACRLTYCGTGIQNVTVDDVTKPVANKDEDGSGALDKQKEVPEGNDGSPQTTAPPPTVTTAPISDGFLTDNGDDIGSGESEVKVHRACQDYHILDEPQRSVHNQVDSNTGGSVLLCDKRSEVMDGQWYRFSGEGGDKMPTERPLSDHRCGTHAPVWMKGRHPTVKEGAVTRTVCAFWRGNECNWSWEIDVMACPGGFFVYKLHKPEVCLLAYCTTDGAPLTTVPPPTPSISDETLSENEDEVGSGEPYGKEREVSYLATYKGWHYYKVPVTGKMTATNVKAACEAAGYVTPCPGDSKCRFSSSSCVLTGLLDCDHPMREVSHELCGSTPSADRCSQLHGVYQFMSKWTKGGACGAESGSWCAYGSYVRRDRYAFCATSAGAQQTTVTPPPTTVSPPNPSVSDELLSDDEDEVGSGEPDAIDDVGSGEPYTPGREASYLAHYRGWHYYKVPVTGKMTSANVKAACEAAGYVTPCPGDSDCPHSTSSCVVTGLWDCNYPMNEVSNLLCGTDPNDCAELHGVYQFRNYGSACGAESGLSWCVSGSGKRDRYAFCATDQNITSDAPRDATAAPYDATAAPHVTTAAPYDTTAAPHVTTAAPYDTTAAPHVTTAAPNKDHGNCCGNILRQATEVVDQFSGYRVPDGWTMCYIDESDTAYHDTPCKNLLKGIPGYKNARQLLAVGGNFGCWHGHSGDSPGPAFARNNVIEKSCQDDVQQETRLSAWNVRRTTLGVCIKGIMCVGAPQTTVSPPTPSMSDELPSDDEDDVGSGESNNKGKNLALGKTTEQSSLWDAGYSSNAVDGDRSTNWYGASCTHTAASLRDDVWDVGTTDPWWYVDLGSSHPIGKVVIVNRRARENSVTARISPFELHVGNSKDVGANPTCGRRHVFPAEEDEMVVRCGGIHGRYVGIRLPGENRILTLCEVEVYAEPFPSDDEDDDVGSGVPDESVDRLPCAQHHVIDDLWRHVSNTNESQTCDDDSNIKNGQWHRFMGGRRSMMIPTERPLSKRRCGTHAPVWMKGRHPTAEEGVVTRTACAFWSDDECHWSWEIDVMACPGDYYVYKLQKPTHCNLAYCTTYANLQTTESPVTTVPVPTTPFPSDDEDHDVGSGEADDSDVTPRTRISSLTTIPTPTEAPPSEDEDNADPKELRGSAYTYVSPLACEKHYVLDEPWRSVKTQRDKEYKCDQRTRLQHRHWYRFVGAGGDMMPTKRPPATNRCGTHAPVWMTRGHPNVEEGAVKRRVCAFWEEEECHWSWEIHVMACPGGYYVYRLPKPKICQSAYCTTDSFGVDDEGSGEPEGSGPGEPIDEDDIIFEGSEEEPLPSQESINVCPENNVVTLPSGKKYVAGDGTQTYEDAQKECRRRGGIVAIPRSQEEQRELVFLKNCVSSDNQFWLGVRWRSEGWMDGRGTPLGDFTTWAPGEPDDRYNGYRCAHVVYGSKEGDRRNNWAETYCNSLYNYVCEIEEGVVPNAKAASCSDVKSLHPAGRDGEYTLYPFPTCKDVSIRVYCHNMASEQPEEFLTLPSGPGTNFANIYADRLRDNYGGRCDGPVQDPYSRRAGTTKFSKIRINFEDSRVKVVRDDYTFANTEGHNNVSYGEAGDCYSWKQGCAKGTFVLDLTGTGLSLAPDVRWIMEERYPEYISINDLFISEDRTVASARCGGWCGHCWPAGKNLLLSHPQCDSNSQSSKSRGEDMKDIYRGCYKDGKRRRLPHALLISEDMTADVCVKHCREKGHSYAGTQYHKECWCGDELPRRGPREDDECATPCGGNQKEMCGGGWRLSVYEVESIVDAAVPPEVPECQASDGASYRGTVAVTTSGRTCQRWDRLTPHEHTRTSANYPSSGLEENFCRNPDGTSGVWCYTTDTNKRWELCDVPVCGSIPENPATPPPVSTEVAATTASLRENPTTQVPVHKATDVTSTVCPVSGYVRLNGACYKGFAELKTYDDARQRCAADGGLLAMPKDRATNRFISNLHRASSWLGLTDANSEGRWVFEDGQTLKSSGFANWGRREPNNADGNEHCAEVLSTRSLWNDVPCNSTKGFTCQIGQGVTYVTTAIPPTPTPASRLNPKVTTEERVTVLKSTNVTLRCTLRMRRTNIRHRINWYRVGGNGTQGAPLMTYIDRSAFHSFRRTAALGLVGRLEAVDDHASLRILRVKGEDSGTYRCEVILASQQRSYADVNMTILECPTDKKDHTVISKATPTEVARSVDLHNHPGHGIVVISDSESAFTVALITGAIFSILFVIIVAVVLLAWRKWGK